jgi:glycine/D-amino acid oxidase-like deaminating enzyme
MDLSSDFPFWTVKHGLVHSYSALEGDCRCDAVVIGGGITGALVANSLVRAGVDCIVIDRREIGHGSTSASTALLQYEIDSPLHELIERRGRNDAERAYHLGVEAITGLRELAGNVCGFAMRPSLYVARRQSHVPALRREFDARRRAGLNVQWLDQSDLQCDYGIARPAAIRSAVAAECDPYMLTHHLLQRLARRGLRVYGRTAALHYSPGRTSVTISTDRGHRIRARAVFFASGYETKSIVPANLLRLSSTYALVSEPVADLSWWKRRALVWETGKAYLYCRTCPDGRILIGGADDGVLNPARRDRQIPAKTTRLLSGFRGLWPGHQLLPAFSWAGTFGSTKDGLAYIGRYSEFPRGYFALGFGGNGITFSALAARILTNLFLQRHDPDAALFRFDR